MKIIIVASLLALASQASTIPQPSGQCFDLSATSGFNGIFFGDYRGSSDIEGKIAIEGNGVFADGFSVADKVSEIRNCNGYTAVVKGSLSWKSGRNYYGNIAVGQTSQVASTVLDQGCRVVNDANVFNFATARQSITALSQQLSQMPITVKSKSIDVSLKLSVTLSGSADIEVMQLDSNDFGGIVKELADPVGVKSGATIVFNVKGASASLTNMNMEVLAKYNVIFNFYEATTVRIAGIAVRGTVIAPNASIVDATGVVWGAVYAKSMTGPCQINLKPLSCVKQPAPAPIKCRLRPPVLYSSTAIKSSTVIPTATYVPKVPSSSPVYVTSSAASVLPTTQPVPTTTSCSTTTTTSCSTSTTTVPGTVQAVTASPSSTTTSCSSTATPAATVMMRAYKAVANESVSAATQPTSTIAPQVYQTSSPAASVAAVTASSSSTPLLYQTVSPSGIVAAVTATSTPIAYQTALPSVSAVSSAAQQLYQTVAQVAAVSQSPSYTAQIVYQTAIVSAVTSQAQASPTCLSRTAQPIY